MKKFNKKALFLTLATGMALGGVKSVLAAPTHIVADKKAYKIMELTGANPDYIKAMTNALMVNPVEVYIADSDGKTFRINEITNSYTEAYASAKNMADEIGEVREINGDLTAGNVIVLPGANTGDQPANPEESSQFYYTEVIAPQYEHVRGFSEGLSAVYKDGKWGYINEAGKTVIDFKYDAAYSFSEGKALVGERAYLSEKAEWDDIYLGIIDQAGNYTPVGGGEKGFRAMLSSHQADSADLIYQNGVINVRADSPNDFYFDKAGVMATIYDLVDDDKAWMEAFQFPTEATWVTIIQKNSEVSFNYADRKNGGWLFDNPGFTAIHQFNQGLAPVSYSDYDKDGRRAWTFIDKSGKEWDGPEFYDYYANGVNTTTKIFNDYSLASLEDKDGRWGVVNKEGKVMIPFKYEGLGTFNNGLAWFKENNQYGFVDHRGQEVIAPQFDDVSGFSKGRTLIIQGEDVLLLDMEWKVIKGTGQINADYYFNRDPDTVFYPEEYLVIEQNGRLGYAKIMIK